MSTAALQNPEIVSRFPDYHPPFDKQAAVVEANRCLYCFDAPCSAACPTHIDVPKFIKKIATGNERGSALAILEANILGASCARACPVDVLCEGACVLHRYNRSPIEIGRLQRYSMERFHESGAVLPPVTAAKQAGRVACIGAGPASLACAAELARAGYAVSVFDDRPLPGGLNTYGIAEYKLRSETSLAEVELVRQLGVAFLQHTRVGRDVSLEALEQEFDAVFLGFGLGGMDPLDIPGEHLPGVVDALRFIAAYKSGKPMPIGRRVAVIGGGNTAIDAAIAARKLGAADVTMIYRRSEAEMPAFTFELKHAQLEGVQFLWQTQPTAILANNETGRAEAIECVRVELGEPDLSGRRRPLLIPDSQFEVFVDTVIPALGQSRLAALLADRPEISLTSAGCVVVDRASGRTGHAKYYAGGDCINGGREVVDAVADGKRAARGMMEALVHG